MKNLILVSSFLFTLISIGCEGGSKSLYDDKVLLTPSFINYDFGGFNAHRVDTIYMKDEKKTLYWQETDGQVNVKVEFIHFDESDAENILYTIFSITKNANTKYIKIHSNMDRQENKKSDLEPNFKISEEIGCE
jgi:hypothetical protein